MTGEIVEELGSYSIYDKLDDLTIRNSVDHDYLKLNDVKGVKGGCNKVRKYCVAYTEMDYCIVEKDYE